MFGIGGKKKGAPKGGMQGAGQKRVPVEDVVTLSSRGFSEPEIVNALKKQGYSIPEIDNAMKGALRNAATNSPSDQGMNSGFDDPSSFNQPDNMPSRGGNEFRPPPGMDLEHPSYNPSGQQDRSFDNNMRQNQISQQDMGFDERPQFDSNYGMDDNTGGFNRGEDDFDMPKGNQFDSSIPKPKDYAEPMEKKPLPSLDSSVKEKKVSKKQVEELVEVIIEEKWHDMKSKLNEVDTKFLDINNKIVAVENAVRQMRNERDDELKQISDKIDTYRNSLTDMNGKMQSMENAMRDSLTPLISTLRSLSETINNLKEKKGL